MPTELITEQVSVMPTEDTIMTWRVLPWETEMSREDLFAVQIRQLEGRPEDGTDAMHQQGDARVRNKLRFNKKHRVRPQKNEEGDWVVVYNGILDHQHNSIRKFMKRWFGR